LTLDMESSKVGRFLPFQWMTLQASGSHENWLMAEKAAEFRPSGRAGSPVPTQSKTKAASLH
jgi:hypothetical protein